jgi:hypothetical protein
MGILYKFGQSDQLYPALGGKDKPPLPPSQATFDDEETIAFQQYTSTFSGVLAVSAVCHLYLCMLDFLDFHFLSSSAVLQPDLLDFYIILASGNSLPVQTRIYTTQVLT